MRKIFGILFLVGLVAITACGPSKKEQAAEQARQDSIAAVEEQARQDSIAAAEAAAAAAMQQETQTKAEEPQSNGRTEEGRRLRDTQIEPERQDDGRRQRGDQVEDEREEDGRRKRGS